MRRALTPVYRRLKAIEARVPEGPVGRQPLLEFAERLRLQSVEAALTVRTHRHEAGFGQDAKMPRHAGLMDARLGDDVANLLLTAAKRFDDSQPGRIGEHL